MTVSGHPTGIMMGDSSPVAVRDPRIENVGTAVLTGRCAPEGLAYNSVHGNTIRDGSGSAIVMFGNHTSILGNAISGPDRRGTELVSPFAGSVVAGNHIDGTRMGAIRPFGYRNAPHVPGHGRHAEASRSAYVVNNTVTNFHEDAVELQDGA